jgi:hypothetical protein
MPIIRSRVLKNEARKMDRLEKHMPVSIMTTSTPIIVTGVNIRWTRMITARINTTNAWKTARTPAERVLPRTML